MSCDMLLEKQLKKDPDTLDELLDNIRDHLADAFRRGYAEATAVEYDNGWEKGYQAGYRDGYRAGWSDHDKSKAERVETKRPAKTIDSCADCPDRFKCDDAFTSLAVYCGRRCDG